MKQYDIFGAEVEVEEGFNRLKLKDQFRARYGYLQGKQCKNCKYHHRLEYNNKYYHKCKRLGITQSNATDIRLKDIACLLYEEMECFK